MTSLDKTAPTAEAGGATPEVGAATPAPAPGGTKPSRTWRLGESARSIAPLIVAIVVISLYTNNKNDAFLSKTNIEIILLQASVIGIIAIGQTFLVAAGMLDLSVGSLASVASVVAAKQIEEGGSEWWAVVLVLLLGAAAGLFWGLVVAYLRVPPFILTLGGLSAFSSLALVWSGSSPVPVRNNFSWLKSGDVLGVRTPIAMFLAVLVVSAVVLRYTRFGRQVYALGSSEEAAYLAGLPTTRTKVAVFVVSSTLVGLAGLILMSRGGAGDPTSGQGYELKAIAAVVLGGATLAGGRGSAIGTFVAVVLLGVVEAALTFNDVNSEYEDLVFGGVLIFAVVTTAIGDRRRERAGSGRSLWSSLLSRPPARSR
jgi:ribose/xylose/arabinose/galactoside ABC-type transport system permease subunit